MLSPHQRSWRRGTEFHCLEILKEIEANVFRYSGDGSHTTLAPTRSASARHRAASSDICTSRREAQHRNVVTVGQNCQAYAIPSRMLVQGQDLCILSDPSPSPQRVCDDLEAKEDGPTRLWRLPMCQLCQGQSCESIPD